MPSLRAILRANAASCLIFGTLFVLLPAKTAGFLSPSPAPPWLMQMVGLVLIANGLHLLWAASRKTFQPWEILYFSAGDMAWVMITLALIGAGTWITTPGGITAALGVALMVGGFGLTQVSALRTAARADTALTQTSTTLQNDVAYEPDKVGEQKDVRDAISARGSPAIPEAAKEREPNS